MESSVFNNLMLGFSVALTPSILAYAFAGCVIGTLVGMLPGLGPLAGISLLLPATFGLNPIIAIVLLAGVYYGAMYGGSTTSILMRIPGEAASVMRSFSTFCGPRVNSASLRRILPRSRPDDSLGVRVASEFSHSTRRVRASSRRTW